MFWTVSQCAYPARGLRGRPHWPTAEEHPVETPRAHAQAARAAGRRRPRASVQHVTPDPWVPGPAIALSDVVAGPEPWKGTAPRPGPAAAGAHRKSWSAA